MTPERWAEIDRVWYAVLARPETERAAAVAELCAGDAALRQEMESLLANLAGAIGDLRHVTRLPAAVAVRHPQS
jgi:hypothetical protein